MEIKRKRVSEMGGFKSLKEVFAFTFYQKVMRKRYIRGVITVAIGIILILCVLSVLSDRMSKKDNGVLTTLYVMDEEELFLQDKTIWGEIPVHFLKCTQEELVTIGKEEKQPIVAGFFKDGEEYQLRVIQMFSGQDTEGIKEK